MNKLRQMSAEDWKLVPLALLDLARGVGEIVVHELTRHSEKPEFKPASITYYPAREEESEKIN